MRSLWPARAWRAVGTAVVLCAMSGAASAEVTAKWWTADNSGSKFWASTPQETCQAQHDGYAPRNPGPITATPYKGSWKSYLCDWKTHADGPPGTYPIAPLPTLTLLACADENNEIAYSYELVPPGLCILQGEPRTSRPPACFDNSGKPNPTVGNPIIVSNGAKYEFAIDYEDADTRLTIARTYRSRYGLSGTAFPVYAFPFGIGDLWRFNFQWELVLDYKSFSQYGTFGIVSPDGSSYAFVLNEDGSVTPNNNGINGLSAQFVNPSGASVSYSAILSGGGQFVVTTSAGDRITLDLFVREWSPQYLQGHPLQIVHRGGYTWNFTYGSHGEVQAITDNLGRTITFDWYYSQNADDTGVLWPRAIQSVHLPDGTGLNYVYESYMGLQTDSQQFARLKTFERVSAAGASVDGATYLYEDLRTRSALTGIVDHSGARYATWEYDANGHTMLSKHAGDVDQFSIAYSSTATGTYHYRTVTNALGKQTTYTFKRIGSSQMELQLTSVAGAPSLNCLGTTESLTYDSNSRVASSVDAAGYQTKYAYDADGRRQTITEAFGTPLQRVTTYSWNSTFGVPTQIVKPGLVMDFVYDTAGRMLSATQTDTTSNTQPYSTNGTTRQWSFGYNAQGLLSSIDGPLPGTQDTTLYEYNAQGYLNKVSNGAGHVWEVTSLDGAGHPTQVIEPNGATTAMSYDGVGRLKTRTTAGLTTTYDYDLVGNLTRVTLPSGALTQYTYDSARRLTDVQDGLGNRIHYVLDAAGNRIQENVYDPANVLRRTQIKVYDELSRLLEIQGAEQQLTRLGYDLRGNEISETRANQFTTIREFDALNRLFKITDAAQGVSRYDYDALDRLVTVTDPRGLITRYTYDGFGNAIQVQSPDAGTSVYHFDPAGNVASQTDAKGQLTSYSHDALNRLTRITYTDDSTVTFVYDQGSNGVGRLSSMTDTSGATSWIHDALGRVTQKTQTVGSRTLVTKYTYDHAGQLTHLTLPSGRVVRYEWANGKVVNVLVDNGVVTGARVASEITYDPFGPPTTWRFGNGENVERLYDLDGRLRAHALGTVGYDALSRVSSIVQGNRSILHGSKIYGYDAMDRLTSYEDAASNIVYGYDATGNRTQQVGAGTDVSYGIDPASNRISQITAGTATATYQHDANGSVTSDGINSYSYDPAGRLRTAATGSYRYNGLGQRVQKVATPVVAGLPAQGLSTTTLFAYDEAGHLIGEYDGSGNLIQETVWMDDLPIVVLKPEGNYYIHADHLNTPRQIDNSVQQAVWVWDTITFGASSPNESPSGIGVPFRYNLRHAGQYYDQETGLFQNWNRDYNPNLGRYIQSDPIGLAGGINTYAYAWGNPLRFIDPWGLAGIWREGSSPGEPGPHQSIGFGDPNGDNRTFSFGVQPGESPFGGMGEVYEDVNSGGQIFDYYDVPPELEAAVEAELRKKLGETGTYELFSNNCRHFTDRELEDIVKKFGLKKKTPPPRSATPSGSLPGGSSSAPTTNSGVSSSSPGPTTGASQ